MEISVFPAGFNVQPGKAPNPAGGTVDVMILTFIDAGGTIVRVMLGTGDFENFQKAVADHEAAAKAAAARARILAPRLDPNGMAAKLRERKH